MTQPATWTHNLLQRLTSLNDSFEESFHLIYHNDPKFLDRQVWANSADPDQTAPIGGVWSGSTLFAIPAALLFGKSILFKF